MSDVYQCYSVRCGYVGESETAKCPKCGRRMRSSRQIRVLGIIQIVIGLFLVAMMGVITLNLAPMLLHPGASAGGSNFTGTPGQALLILGLFGLIIVFGLGSTLSGIAQVATGRRNKWVLFLMIILIVLLLVGVAMVRGALENQRGDEQRKRVTTSSR